MAGLYSCNSQDTFERKEYDGNASEMMKEGDIRRWEMHHPSCPFFFSSNFHTREGVSLPCLVFSGVIRLLLRLSSFTLPGGAINWNFLLPIFYSCCQNHKAFLITGCARKSTKAPAREESGCLRSSPRFGHSIASYISMVSM